MRSRLYIITVSAIFLFLLIWCPLVYVLSETGAVAVSEIKNERPPERVYESGPFSGVLNKIEAGKAGLDSLYTNYLPLYGEIVTLFGSINTDMQMSFADLFAGGRAQSAEETADIEEPVESIVDRHEFSAIMLVDDGLHRYYAIRPFDFIDTALSFSEERLRGNMEVQIAHINRIAAATAAFGADFYLYIGKPMQDAEYFTKIVPNEITTAPYFDEFMDRITGAAGKGALDVDTLESRLENIFLTDHHWSALGTYSGYCDIIGMINKNSPEIGGPLPLWGLIGYEEVKMRGSASLISSFPRFTETFRVMDITLPEKHSRYKVTDNARRYESGAFDKNMYADHYAQYYNLQNRYVYPSNDTGRNLLIIGDSFTWWGGWLIAANFDETHIYYPWDRKRLNYADFIYDNRITDVVCVLFSDRIIFNIYNDCPLENIKTD